MAETSTRLLASRHIYPRTGFANMNTRLHLTFRPAHLKVLTPYGVRCHELGSLLRGAARMTLRYTRPTLAPAPAVAAAHFQHWPDGYVPKPT